MVEVKYLGVVIGYTYDNCKTIVFIDNEVAEVCKNNIFKNKSLFISSRQKGTIGDDNIVAIEEAIEYCITKCNET